MPSIRARAHLVLLLGAPLVLMSAALWSRGSGADADRTGIYAEHPPLGHTGGFGEPTCRACHFGSERNDGGGTLRVDGLPDTVRAGETYDLAVDLTADMERSGFMLAVRFARGRPAGTLSAVDTARVAIASPDTSEVQYAHHTLEGTALTDSTRAR